MASKEYVFHILKELGYSGNKTELRKEYKHLFIVVKPQKSRFGDEVYLNFGVIYKELMTDRTPKLKDCQLTFRYRQLLMALKKDKFQFGIDGAFHKKNMRNQFEKNINNYFENMISELDDLKKMKSDFPNNIPVLASNEDNVDYIVVVSYLEAEKQLKEYFELINT